MKEKVRWNSKNKKDIEAKRVYVTYKLVKKAYKLRCKKGYASKDKQFKDYRWVKYWRRTANTKLNWRS